MGFNSKYTQAMWQSQARHMALSRPTICFSFLTWGSFSCGEWLYFHRKKEWSLKIPIMVPLACPISSRKAFFMVSPRDLVTPRSYPQSGSDRHCWPGDGPGQWDQTLASSAHEEASAWGQPLLAWPSRDTSSSPASMLLPRKKIVLTQPHFCLIMRKGD